VSRALGLDVGERRIGVAISDTEGMMALPLITIHRKETEGAVMEIAELVRKHEADRIVVGLPALMSGDMGEQADRVDQFVEHLKEHIVVPVEMWDERLSTVAAEKMMRDVGANRKSRDANRDMLAATLILQAYLDSKRMYRP
jgi:putative Holliday junction resolvase